MAESAVADAARVDNAVWKILVVDDEPAIHQVTKLALRNLSVHGRPSQLINALSARDAREQLAKHPDIAVVLLDVVMETEDAGLEFIKHIRQQAANPLVRIILRTGQPGQAPERQVMIDYDINDYKEKTELTANKLFTTVMASIRTFEHLQTMQSWRCAVEVLSKLNGKLFSADSESALAACVVAQLAALDGFSSVSCWMGDDSDAPASTTGLPVDQTAQRALLQLASRTPGTVLVAGTLYAATLELAAGKTLQLCVAAPQPLNPASRHLLDLWLQSAAPALAHWAAACRR